MNQSWHEQYKEMWNDRYKQEEYVYGKAPNAFFKECLEKLAPGSILMPADGEGRNGVFAARLGWRVTAFDISGEARAKALQLANAAEVTIEYLVGGLDELDFEKESFDAIGLIYAHFGADKISSYHRKLSTLLKPGGVLIFEAFSKSQLHVGKAGPKDIDMLFSTTGLMADFQGYHVATLEEKEIYFDEGPYHQGKGAVVRFVGRKGGSETR